MLDARRYPHKPNGVGISYARTSDWTRRDFEFSSIIVTGVFPPHLLHLWSISRPCSHLRPDHDDYLHTVDATYHIGTIALQLWRIEVDDVSAQTLKHQYGVPTLDHQIVHERSKKAGSHHVV